MIVYEKHRKKFGILYGILKLRVTRALEVYCVYRGKGLDARLVCFPNENHWIQSPQNSIFWYKEVHDWLERYMGD
ncbi:MAG: prolyl oligopeptidase family serine peptidase [Cyclonatronaceae bacterium]